MKILSLVTKCFGTEGVYFDKDVKCRLALRMGRDSSDTLGEFAFNMQGKCNVARKIALWFGIMLLCAVMGMMMKKKN